jgi:dipeptidyl aminopeptidase/acylaminoacyl peptidase
MPSQVVVWTRSFRIEVVSARSGQLLRTLATGVALDRGLPTVAASPAGVVYFDQARGAREWVMSVRLAGGHIRRVAQGRHPAISPDGRLLAYVTDAGAITGVEAIVVRNLATGTRRRWAYPSTGPDIDSLSWSPDGRFLAFTVNTRPFGAATVRVLDTRRPGPLSGTRAIPLGQGLQWAGYLTPRTGLAVATRRGEKGRGSQQVLVAVAVRTGLIIRRLISLRAPGLFTANSSDGTENAVTTEPTGHYVLIAGSGPDGHGEIYRLTIGTHHLVPLAGGAIRASWAPS